MHFTIDTVTEFTYFENILLGLADELNKHVGVKNTSVKKCCPISYPEIALWEQKNLVLLPDDLREFYTSSNGFHFEWTYCFGISGENDDVVISKININPLEAVTQIFGYETASDSGVRIEDDRYIIRLAPESKVFEFATVSDVGKVVLIYLYPKYAPTIWLFVSPIQFYYLADDIATYLLMAIVHFGIPNWQLAYTPIGVPQWTENMFRMLTPHLLPLNKRLEKLRKVHRSKKDDEFPEVPLNKLDKSIIKILPRTSQQQAQHYRPATPNTDSLSKERSKSRCKKKLTPKSGQGSKDQVKLARPIYQRKPLYYIKKR